MRAAQHAAKSSQARICLLVAALGLFLGSSVPARVQLAAPPAQTAPPATDFPIGIADLLDITVLGVQDFTRELRVSAAGTIRFPFLGEIKVDGLMPAQLEKKLAELLHPDYVKDPQVSVTVKEPRSRMFSLMGAVIRPGQYQMLEQVTLVTAIAGAGGLNIGRAGDKAMIQRTHRDSLKQGQAATAPVADLPDRPGSGYQIEVDLRKLLQGNMSLDIPIMPGDVVNIPEREATAFYVVGEVNKPGPFEFPTERGIKLTRAIAMAGGPTKTSKLKDTALIRQQPDGSMDRLALDLDKVLKGKAPDIELRPNDMIYVPNSIGKNIGWGLLGAIPMAAMTRLIYPF